MLEYVCRGSVGSRLLLIPHMQQTKYTHHLTDTAFPICKPPLTGHTQLLINLPKISLRHIRMSEVLVHITHDITREIKFEGIMEKCSLCVCLCVWHDALQASESVGTQHTVFCFTWMNVCYHYNL